ncbi:MAG: SagB/ThcOx family dehydrogenase [Desulfovermiculus sp.]
MNAKAYAQASDEVIALPEVKPESGSLTNLMYERRSVRTFASGSVSLEQISRVLFAAQGITRNNRYRTVPSAGALYPLELYLVSGEVSGLETGVYRYRPRGHELVQVTSGDKRQALAGQAYQQMWVAEAQAVVVITAVYERVTGKYGQRGERYAHIEAGCAAQNLSLAGYNLGLGSTVVGAFSDQGVAEVIKAGEKERPLIVMPVGLLQ